MMIEITLLTPINYARPSSSAEEVLSNLSNYFYLGGAQATVVKGYEVQLENGEVSWQMIALKIASYVLLFPLTLLLFATHLILRSQHHFTVITASSLNKKPIQATIPELPQKSDSSVTQREVVQ